MSDTDSFIDEVTEEVQRDQLFAMLRKYGWIAIVLVVAIVGGAAYNEYRKSQISSKAEAFGDSLIAAVRTEDADARIAALEAIETDEANAGLVALLTAGQISEDDQLSKALDALRSLANDTTQPEAYRQLAALKLVMQGSQALTQSDRRDLLTPLAQPGAPFYLIAGEQLALIDVEAGETEAAIDRLNTLIQDNAATQSLRERAQQLIVALGGAS